MVLSIFSVCLCQHNSWRPLHRGRSVCSGLTDSSSITAALKARFNDVLYFLSHCPPFPLSHSRVSFFLFSSTSHVFHYFTTTSLQLFHNFFLFAFFIPLFFHLLLPLFLSLSTFYRLLPVALCPLI